jgi:hypothetical protein
MSEHTVKLMHLLLAVPLALALGGCASVGSLGSGSGPAKVQIGDISKLPQVQLPGASMEDARSVAMAAARTKGWDITAADANRLLLERPLPPDLPQAQALSSTLAPPRMQVETDIVDRRDGAIVALQAFAITNPGTKDEKRIDYTSDYENQLLISLSSLSSAWLAARDNVHSQVPTLAEFQQEHGGETEANATANLGDVAETVSAGGTAVAAAPTRSAPQPAPQAAAPRTAPASQPSWSEPAPRIVESSAPAPATSSAPPTTQVASSTLVAPTIEAPASPTTAAEAATPPQLRPGATGYAPAAAPMAPVEPAGSNDMLVLNQGSQKGLWAYYAEDFARLRGCSIGDHGAMLLQQAGGFEVHEVECTNGTNVLVKCRGGVCEAMR